MKRVDIMDKIAFFYAISTLTACSQGVASQPVPATQLRGEVDNYTTQLDRKLSTEGRRLQVKASLAKSVEVSMSMSSMLCMSFSPIVESTGLAEFVYVSAEDVPIEDVVAATSHKTKSSTATKSTKSPVKSPTAKSTKSPAMTPAAKSNKTATKSPVGPSPAAKSAKSQVSARPSTVAKSAKSLAPVGPPPIEP